MRHLTRLPACVIPALIAAGALPAQAPVPIDPTAAARWFAEADSLARRDGGRLWGRSLAGPMMFVDRATRALVANQTDTEDRLTPSGAVFAGTLPPDQSAANTAFVWSGRRWTMVLLPLPADPAARAILMLHEMWHRIQDSLGFAAASPSNAHLDGQDGRLWLRLEGRALQAALRSTGHRRRQAIADALAFRRYRRSLAPWAGSEERALELNEGLAEYTAYALTSATGRRGDRPIAGVVAALDTSTSLARSFAYLTGPAWGRLLDGTGAAWRQSLGAGDDLAERLASVMRLPCAPAGSDEAVRRARRYGYQSVLAEETERARNREVRLVEFRRRFLTGPVVRLPLRAMRLTLDPGDVESLDSAGTVYGTMRITDRWGVLEVTRGGGLIRDWLEAVVPGPVAQAGDSVSGNGWSLTLMPGWRLVTGSRTGDLTLSGPDSGAAPR